MFEEYCAPSVEKIERQYPFYIFYATNYEKNLCFVLINKCASSTIKHTLPNYGFKISNDVPKVDNFYTVIREPNNRWISGINEFMVRFRFNTEETTMVETLIKENKFVFDHHTYPQYINLNDIENLTKIRFDSDLQKNLEQICGHEIKMINKNHSCEKKESDRRDLCMKWFELYAKHNEKFLNLYEKDYDLYEQSRL